MSNMSMEIVATGGGNRNRPIKVKASNWFAVSVLFAVLTFVAPIVAIQWVTGAMAVLSVGLSIHYFFHEKPSGDQDSERSAPVQDLRKLY